MMNNKKLFLLSILFVGIAIASNAQNNSKNVDVEVRTRNAIYSDVDNDVVSDTLVLNKDTMLFFRHTPLIFFDGYSKLFTLDEGVLVLDYLIGNKGYYCKWTIKNNQLYLENVSFSFQVPKPNTKDDNVGYTKFEKDKDGNLIIIDVLLPSLSTAKSRIEELTSRKFNEEGLLKADWMTGNFVAYSFQQAFSLYNDFKKDQEFRAKRHSEQKKYIVSFTKGQLNQIKQVDK